MATAAVIGLSAGKRLLSSSFYYSDFSEKLSYSSSDQHHHVASSRNVVIAAAAAKRSSNFLSQRQIQSTNALKDHLETASADPSNIQPWLHRSNLVDEESADPDYSVEALLLLQKSMLEKQWNLSAENKLVTGTPRGKICNQMHIASSGSSARRRRLDSRRYPRSRKSNVKQLGPSRQLSSIIGSELLQNRLKGYVKGVISEELLSHTEVVQLSKKIKQGLCLEEQKARYLMIFPSSS